MTATVEIYTDGACRGNPGPGGWGALLIAGKHRKSLHGGEHETTNNRMELTAAIEALNALRGTRRVILHTDSKYVKEGIESWRRLAATSSNGNGSRAMPAIRAMKQPMRWQIAVSMNCERIEYRPSGRAPTKALDYVAAPLLEPVLTGDKENGASLIRALLEPC